MSSEKYYDALSGGNDLTKTPLKNIAASVRQRLLNKSRSDGRINLLSYGSAQESIMRIESSNIANELMKSIEGA